MGLEVVVARTHPGTVIHYWDHLVITLRNDTIAGAVETAGTETAETAFLSLYAITYSPTLGPGHVAIVEVEGALSGPLIATFTDDEGLGRRQRDRLRAMGDGRAALVGPPVLARFERIPFRDRAFGFIIHAAHATIAAHWDDLGDPVWVDGQGGGFSDREDISSIFVGAARARLIIDGVAIPGSPWEDDVWQPKLGRSLSSAHGAFGEIRVEPVSDRAIGSAPDGRR